MAEKDCSKLTGATKKKCLDEQKKKKGKPTDTSKNLPPWLKKGKK